MTPIVDGRKRDVSPRHGAKNLRTDTDGRAVSERVEEGLGIGKTGRRNGKLEEIMDRDPNRTGEPERVSPREMKRVWYE